MKLFKQQRGTKEDLVILEKVKYENNFLPGNGPVDYRNVLLPVREKNSNGYFQKRYGAGGKGERQ